MLDLKERVEPREKEGCKDPEVFLDQLVMLDREVLEV